jgi:hypothetical protein
MTEDLSIPEQVQADLCLKFPDEAAAFAALYEPVTQTVTTYDEEGMAVTETTEVPGEFKPRHQAAIDTIGVIYQPIGDLDAEGNFLTAALPGWHVNLRGVFTPDELAVLAPFVVTPENPVRVWA